MKKVLVFGMTENPGGVESFLMNYYRNIDRTQLQFDFLCNSHNQVAYEDELVKLGASVYHITSRKENALKFRRELNSLFSEHAGDWDAIWVNVCSLANIDYLKIARRYGLRKRVIHSHNSENMDSFLRGILHKINMRRIENYATDFWACSNEAAKWFYNDKLLRKVIVIQNAIDVDKMRFDPEKRKTIREQLGVSDEVKVIGNVGRLHFQKNQEFILDVFSCYVKKQPESILVLIGQGEDGEKLKAKSRDLGIDDKVIFAGLQRDIPAWLSALDLFLFPSKFEGLSVAALEAQANGVPMLASDRVISPDTKVNDNFVFYGLENSPEMWSGKIDEVMSLEREKPEDISRRFSERGFDIREEAVRLRELFDK